jgi:hypothetical protein
MPTPASDFINATMLYRIDALFVNMSDFFHQITDKGKTFTVMAALRRSRNKRASMSAVAPIGVPPSTDGVVDITRVEASAMYVPCSAIVL